MSRFFFTFLALLAVLFGVEMLGPVQQAVVQPWTGLVARACAAVMAAFDADVFSHGRVLGSRSTGFGVSIEAGCNGVEAALILIAAVVAFPAGWKLRLAGIALGVLAIQVANLLRIVSLYYLGQWNMAVFEFAHLYVWQALIMLDVLVVWLLWVSAVARRSGAGRLRQGG
jgi:exosortase H (IPTLxxWG-CTERM-specific)